MNAQRTLRLLGALTFASLLAGTFVVACGSDDSNPSPTSPVYTIDGSTSPTDSSVTPQPDGGDGSTPADSGPPIADTGPLPDVDAAGCTQDSGCWSCTPGTEPEFLNQCTASHCTPFDNARVPNYDGGTLTWNN